MQLTRILSRALFAFAFVFPSIASAQQPESAGDHAAERKEDVAAREAETGKAPEDVTTKKIAVDVGAYTDTDSVSVLTPSIAASIDNVTTGASLRGSYLVDVVSAASVDIVSTASRRWTEARQAGSIEGEYKPHDFGISAAGSVSSEPDYFSFGAGVTMTYD
ncbi:MAG TPA: hypothetical protein VF407_06910, partial [Polyangiaceae bacterium]